MSLFHSSKSLISIAVSCGLVTISNFVFADVATAFNVTFSNGGFESSIAPNDDTGWESIGDVTTIGEDIVQGNGSSVNPISGSFQAIITNAYRTAGDRNDDSSLTFNQSGTTDPVDADTITDNHTGEDLQTFLGLGTDDLSIDRDPAVTGNPRTLKEGSGLYQDINITIDSADVANGTNAFEISFNWAYLSNDGNSNDFGNQDFGFVSVYDTASTPGAIELLGDSDQTITAPTTANNFNHLTATYYDAGNPDTQYTQSVTGLAAGNYTYRVGFGVVDVDNYTRSSALLIDNFNVQQVPFEFSPTAGIALVLGLFGCDRLRRKGKKTEEMDIMLSTDEC